MPPSLLQISRGFLEGSLKQNPRAATLEARLGVGATLRPQTAAAALQGQEDLLSRPSYQVLANLEVGDGFGGGLDFLQDETIAELGVLAKTELKLYSLPVSAIPLLSDAGSAFQQMKDEVHIFS